MVVNKGLGLAYVLSNTTQAYFVPKSLIFKKDDKTIVEKYQFFKTSYKQFSESLKDAGWTTWELHVYICGVPYIIKGDDTTFVHIEMEERNESRKLAGISMNCLMFVPKDHDYWNYNGNNLVDKIVDKVTSLK